MQSNKGLLISLESEIQDRTINYADILEKRKKQNEKPIDPKGGNPESEVKIMHFSTEKTMYSFPCGKKEALMEYFD